MISAYRTQRASRKANKIKKGSNLVDVEVEVTISDHFRCPISLELMKDPVTSTGITYDRDSVEKWIYEDGKHTCPVTGVSLTTLEPVPNHMIRKIIQNWCVENKSNGFDRIPTPRAPTSSYQVSDILSKIIAMTAKGNADGVLELVVKIKDLAKESERNKICIIVNGSARRKGLMSDYEGKNTHPISRPAISGFEARIHSISGFESISGFLASNLLMLKCKISGFQSIKPSFD